MVGEGILRLDAPHHPEMPESEERTYKGTCGGWQRSGEMLMVVLASLEPRTAKRVPEPGPNGSQSSLGISPVAPWELLS